MERVAARARRAGRWVVVGAVLVFAACSTGPGDDPANPAGPRGEVITLTTADDGRTIRAATDDQIVLRLKQDPDCPGYAWFPKSPPDEEVLRYDLTSVEEPSGDTPGHDIWTYTAIGQGTTGLTLRYVDPDQDYEPGHKVVTFSVTVKVRP